MLPLLATSLLAGCATSPTGRNQLMLVSPESAIVESKKAYLFQYIEETTGVHLDPEVLTIGFARRRITSYNVCYTKLLRADAGSAVLAVEAESRPGPGRAIDTSFPNPL